MKYAIISARGSIRKIFDEKPEEQDTIEISDAKATEAQALIDAKEQPVLFEGEITTRKAEREAGNRFRWDAEARAMVRTPTPVRVPGCVSRRGLRKALLTIGLTFDQVRIAVEKEQDRDVRARALIDLEDAQMFHREHPLVVAMGAALGKTEADVDALFVLAATL